MRLLFLAAILLPGVALAQQGNASNGQKLFERNGCYWCHGTGGQGGRDGARIAQVGLNLQGFMRYVRAPAGAMPAFTDKVLSNGDLTDIYAYLKALPAAKPSKDVPLLNRAGN